MNLRYLILISIFIFQEFYCYANGFVILSSGKDIQSQLTRTETVYEIRGDFQVEKTLLIPAKSTLVFRGGKIIGGDVVFNETKLEGTVCFSSCKSFKGKIHNEVIFSSWFVGNKDLFQLLNQLVSNNDNKRIIIAKNTYNVRTPLLIRRRTGLDLDFNGATIVDETQGESKLLHRANPMIFIRASKNVTLKNLNYVPSPHRFLGESGTDIICVGALSADWDEDTYNIRIECIEGSGDFIQTNSKGKRIESGFIGIYGNAHDVNVENVFYKGNIGCLCNIEYGLAPDLATNYKSKYGINLPNYYGLHPYNIKVSNITGYNSPNSFGYLRTSSCYNVVFENCYGYNVNRLFYFYNGDQSINRVNGSVIVRNCASYINEEYSNNSLYGIMIQNVYANPNSKVVHEQRIRHNLSYIIENCEFQGLPNKSGTGILITGNDGSIVARNITIRGFDSAMEAYAVKNQRLFCNLFVENCLFDTNKKGILLSGMKNARVSRTKFWSNEAGDYQAQLLIDAQSERILVDDCDFSMGLKSPYIIVEREAGEGNRINSCRFDKEVEQAVSDVAKRSQVVSQ